MNIILFEEANRDNLLPLTYTRPVSKIRIGILTIQEKWERILKGNISYITQDYLSEKYPISIADQNILINGSILPTKGIIDSILELKDNEVLLLDDELIAANLNGASFYNLITHDSMDSLHGIPVNKEHVVKINHLWDIFQKNDIAIKYDFDLITNNRESCILSTTNTLIGPKENLFIEEGAVIEGATLNTTGGPIYIGSNAIIMEGSMIRGPFSICHDSTVKMGAKIYGPTTIGPHCKVGGEINNSVFFGYSNKAHDGFLGNSVIGEWCNIGADSNNSNLKNNYANVKLWSYPDERFVDTENQFCGLIMGDHSKCGINTMFNTGTVIGVSCNIFGSGFPRNFIPSFSWGGSHGYTTYKLPKVYETTDKVMARRNELLTESDRNIFETVYTLSSKYRSWEK